jgi:hypothetical protein
MKVTLDLSGEREVGAFIDYQAFNEAFLDGRLSRLLPSQRIRQSFPKLIAADPARYDHRLFISHRWESPDDPDPPYLLEGTDTIGWQLVAIREICGHYAENGKSVCFWYDYCSLPQKPRNDVEEREFRDALPNIGFLCRVCKCIPLISGGEENKDLKIRRILNRGWILFEVSVATFCGHISDMIFQTLPTGVESRKSRNEWKDIIPSAISSLSYDRADYVLRWFELNGIECTNGSDLAVVAKLFVQNTFDNVAGLQKPRALLHGRTHILSVEETLHYRITLHGLSPFFPHTYFESVPPEDPTTYAFRPRRRPQLQPPGVKSQVTSTEFGELLVDKDTGISPMYPGIKFVFERLPSGDVRYHSNVNDS